MEQFHLPKIWFAKIVGNKQRIMIILIIDIRKKSIQFVCLVMEKENQHAVDSNQIHVLSFHANHTLNHVR